MEPFAIDFRQLGEDSSSLIIAFDAEFRYTYVNPQVERLINTPREQLLGRTIWEVAPHTEGTIYAENYRRAMVERVVIEFEDYYPPLDRWNQVRCVPESSGGLIVFARNVTEEHRAQSAREEALSLLNAVISGTTDMVAAMDRERRFLLANDAVARFLGYSSPDELIGKSDFELLTSPDDREMLQRLQSIDEAILNSGQARTFEFVTETTPNGDGPRTFLANKAPLRDSQSGEVVGLVSIIHDITESKRREERERAHLENILMQAPAFMGVTRGPSHIFEMANPPYYKLVGHRDIIGKPVVEAIPEVVEQGFIPILDEVYRTGKPYIGNSVRLLLQVNPDSPLEERFVDFVFQPLFDEEKQVSGILAHGIDLTERRRLEIEQERMLEEARTRAEREALLNRIGQAIRNASAPQQVLAVAVCELGMALKSDRCYYAAYDQDADRVSVDSEWHREGITPLAGQYRMSSFIVNAAPDYKAGRTQVIAEVRDDPMAESLGLRALLRVPLVSGPSMTAMCVAMAGGPRNWTPEEVSLVESVVTLTQTALEAVRIRVREHRIAEQLAKALQPPNPPAAPGLALADYYRPAWEDHGVGGDFSDVFSDMNGMTYLIVGDLSGKGLAAASQVATVRHMLRFALLNGRSLAGPVRTVNRTLADYELLTAFATLFVGRFDSQSRTLTYVNCGQDAGLILRAATGAIEAMPPTGPVFGALSKADYSEKSIDLLPKDILLLYTDGLTEAGPSREAMLSGDGVANLLSGLAGETNPQSIVERLMAGVDSYAGAGVRDDQCLLVGVVLE